MVSGEAAKQLCTWAVGCVIAVGCATACCFCTSGFLWCQCPQSHFPGSDSKPNQTTINHTITTMLKGSHVGGWGSFVSCSGPLMVCHKHSTINLHCDPAYLAGSVALLDLEVFRTLGAPFGLERVKGGVGRGCQAALHLGCGLRDRCGLRDCLLFLYFRVSLVPVSAEPFSRLRFEAKPNNNQPYYYYHVKGQPCGGLGQGGQLCLVLFWPSAGMP